MYFTIRPPQGATRHAKGLGAMHTPRRPRTGRRPSSATTCAMDASRDGISKLMLAEKEAQAIVRAAREGETFETRAHARDSCAMALGSSD